VNNHPDEFPDLNLYTLQRYACRWAAERPSIKGIRLYHYRSILYSRYMATEKAKYYSTRFAVVFDGDDLKKLSTDITDDQGIYPSLIDSSFLSVYRVKPDTNFRYDWHFTTNDRAIWNQFSSVMVNEGFWVLYPAKENQAPAAEAVALKENSLDISSKEPLIPASANEVVFSYVSPTEVMVKCGNKRAASYKQIDLGFKKEKKPKAWNAFLDLLKSGKSSIDFGKSGTTDNDNTRKIYKFINDKLVDFLRSKLKMPLPHDVKLFERDKAAATGIYKINFRIGKYNTNSIGVEDLPDDKLMAEIKKCLTEQEKLNRVHRGDKTAETQSEEIRERIIPLLMEAQSRKLIDDKAMKSYMNALNPPEHD
jgi:hypothetical protein